MTTNAIKTDAFRYDDVKAYLFAILFTAGNLLLPQLCHLAPNGGLMLLPIYFFTLIAAYKYGWTVGLMTALFSPLANHYLFGMPVVEMLPVILVKSTLLASAAVLVSQRTNAVSLWSLLVVVLAYQVVGTLIEWAIVKDFLVALQDFRLGIPGMLIQVLGGYGVLRLISKY